MKTYRATVKTARGEQVSTVRATDLNQAKRLFEQQGRLVYVPVLIAS